MRLTVTQSELLAFAMQLVTDRVTARAQGLDLSGDPREVVERAIEELLPLDEARQVEAEIWFAFVSQSMVDPALRAQKDDCCRTLEQVFRDMVDALARSGRARPDLDAEVEAERLYALTDGLAVHAVLQPGRISSELMRAAVRRHLDDLCGERLIRVE